MKTNLCMIIASFLCGCGSHVDYDQEVHQMILDLKYSAVAADTSIIEYQYIEHGKENKSVQFYRDRFVPVHSINDRDVIDRIVYMLYYNNCDKMKEPVQGKSLLMRGTSKSGNHYYFYVKVSSSGVHTVIDPGGWQGSINAPANCLYNYLQGVGEEYDTDGG